MNSKERFDKWGYSDGLIWHARPDEVCGLRVGQLILKDECYYRINHIRIDYAVFLDYDMNPALHPENFIMNFLSFMAFLFGFESSPHKASLEKAICIDDCIEESKSFVLRKYGIKQV